MAKKKSRTATSAAKSTGVEAIRTRRGRSRAVKEERAEKIEEESTKDIVKEQEHEERKRFESPQKTRSSSSSAAKSPPRTPAIIRSREGKSTSTAGKFISPESSKNRKAQALTTSTSPGPGSAKKESISKEGLLRSASKQKQSSSSSSSTVPALAERIQSSAVKKSQVLKSRPTSTVELEQKVHLKTLYSLIRKKTGALGGGGAGGAIYGEITQESFQRVVDLLVNKCEFSKDSVFLDIGSGLGKPNFHVSINPGVKKSLGIELIGGRWWQSISLLGNCLNETALRKYARKTFFAHADVTALQTFDPISHVYSFNRGFPPEVMRNIAKTFNSSTHSKYFICFDREKKLKEGYGFDVELVDFVSVKMAGSGEGHRVFIYKRATSKGKQERKASEKSIKLKKEERPSKASSSSSSSSSAIPFELETGDEESDNNEEKQEREDEFRWTLVEPPTQTEYAPHVPHGSTYMNGLKAMATSISSYMEWVQDQIGLTSSERGTRNTRQRTRQTSILDFAAQR